MGTTSIWISPLWQARGLLAALAALAVLIVLRRRQLRRRIDREVDRRLGR